MATLAGIVVFVVIAFLIETTAADGEFALPRLQAMDGGVLGIVTERLLDLPGVGQIRFALENADLLFVGFSALHLHLCLRFSPASAM
jgi:hypothetical protein